MVDIVIQLLPHILAALIYGALGFHFWNSRWRAGSSARPLSVSERGLLTAALGLHGAVLVGDMLGGTEFRFGFAHALSIMALLAVAFYGVESLFYRLEGMPVLVLPPAAFLAVRYVMMPACAALLLLRANQWRWLKLPRRDTLQLLGLGLLAHTLHVSMVTFGIHWSTAFSSALIMACTPVFTLLILHAAGIERLTRGQVAGHDVLENLLGQKFGKRFDGFAEGNRRLGGGWAHGGTLSQFIRLTIVRQSTIGNCAATRGGNA